MTYDRGRFADTVLSDFAARQGSLIHKDAASAYLPTQTFALGHPQFERLPVGGSRVAPIAAVFIDLTDFTGRTFWDPATQVADLAHAVLSGFVETVHEFGGFPLGLRGDGLFAGFGPSDNGTVDCSLALAACSFALNAVQEGVNPLLVRRGIKPVQARAGVDYGEITFIRTGSDERNEINPIGFAANFAAKCEKKAKSWEVVVGQGAVQQLGDATHCVEHKDSPKRYQRDYEIREYDFYDYKWKQILPLLPSVLRELNGQPATNITTK